MVFEKPQALGGHISKKHPGKSKVYAQKMITRDSRTEDRQFLKQAKQMLLECDPQF
jgi:hypothetical protein